MPALAQALRTRMFGKDFLAGVTTGNRPGELALPTQGGIFWDVLPKVNARVVIEVGSWRGRSASVLAEHFRRNNIDGAVICVDTWLGSLEHYQADAPSDWSMAPYLQGGYPTLYHQFIANLTHLGLIDYIVPIPNTSIMAARWLARLGIQADFVYIDASHEREDVAADLKAYFPLVRQGGVFAGDDYMSGWPGVITAVVEFFDNIGLPHQLAGNTWYSQKTITRDEKRILDLLTQHVAGIQQSGSMPRAA
jgi:predicted O-methyltransferase YrrM